MANARRAWVSIDALDQIAAEVSRCLPLETGGLLVGYTDTANAVVITQAVGPGPHARHARFSFSPDHDAQQAELARIYEESGRVCSYLGDWHSHPLGLPAPSMKDRRTLARIRTTASARQPHPVMGIVTVHDHRAELAMWELRADRDGVPWPPWGPQVRRLAARRDKTPLRMRKGHGAA